MMTHFCIGAPLPPLRSESRLASATGLERHRRFRQGVCQRASELNRFLSRQIGHLCDQRRPGQSDELVD
jgi:hypothetical protein